MARTLSPRLSALVCIVPPKWLLATGPASAILSRIHRPAPPTPASTTVLMQENRRAIWSWAFIDWGNSAFSVVMLTSLFPVFLTDYWCNVPGMTPERSSLYWGLANGVSSGLIAILAPVLGSI